MEHPLRATADEQQQFEERGFFVREEVFSPAEVRAMQDSAEKVHSQVLASVGRSDVPTRQVDNQRYQTLEGVEVKWEWREELNSVRSMEPVHHLDSHYDALMDEPRLWGPCRDLIGCEELSLFTDKLNVKRPGGAPFPWHQEAPYWVYDAEQVDKIVSALIYLDDANKENGCFWVIAGSHRHGTLEGLKDRGVLGALYTDVDLIDGEAVPIEAPAGSVTYFHSEIVHGSQTNRSQRGRRLYIVAYQPPGLKRWQIDGHRDIQVR